jgi:DNA-binding XRE family transcriptional regulator
MSAFVHNVEFVTEECCNCHMQFAMTRDYFEKRRADQKTFYCPAGHAQHYTVSSEQKLRQQVERERSMREAAEARAATAARQRDQVTKSHRRMRTRVMNGVCPCCNRTFQNLMQHMKTQHEGEFSLRNIRDAFGMTQAAVAEEVGIQTTYISLYERMKPVPDYAKQSIEIWIASQDKGE